MGWGGNKPNELPQGRQFLCFKSINNGDERKPGLQMISSGRKQPTGPSLNQREAEALHPPTTPVQVQLNLARQQHSQPFRISRVLNCYVTLSLLLPLFPIKLTQLWKRALKHIAAVLKVRSMCFAIAEQV